MTCNYTAEDKNVMRVSAQAKNKSRLQELIDFAKISGFKKIGVANCKGGFSERTGDGFQCQFRPLSGTWLIVSKIFESTGNDVFGKRFCS